MHSYLNMISKGQNSQNLGTHGKWSLAFLCYFYSVIALSGKKKKDLILDNFTVQSNQHFYSCQKTPSVYSAWVHKKATYCTRVIQLSRGVRRTKKNTLRFYFSQTHKHTHTNISYGLCFLTIIMYILAWEKEIMYSFYRNKFYNWVHKDRHKFKTTDLVLNSLC